ncbi:MAG: hypothetical protein ABW006_14555 [Hyphomicrobium sp.]|jgi:hypothetical protein
MPKPIGLRNLDGQKRAQLVAHLKHVSISRENSMARDSLDGPEMNENVQAVLKVLDDIYLKK